MSQPKIHIDVRSPTEGISILDMQGEITGSAEDALFAAYSATVCHAKTILLNFSGVQSVDSLGAGLLITLLARVRKKKRQRLLAYGLNAPCRQAFDLTHLNEAVSLYTDEATALAGL